LRRKTINWSAELAGLPFGCLPGLDRQVHLWTYLGSFYHWLQRNLFGGYGAEDVSRLAGEQLKIFFEFFGFLDFSWLEFEAGTEETLTVVDAISNIRQFGGFTFLERSVLLFFVSFGVDDQSSEIIFAVYFGGRFKEPGEVLFVSNILF
jgi:hypothetical protein